MDKVNLKDFQKMDLRIGTVVKAEIPKWSHWVIKLTVDIGPVEDGGGPSRKIVVFAGIMKWYKPEDLEGKQFPFITNIEPKKIGPERDYSEGMMLAVDVGSGENEKCVLFNLREQVPNGTKIR